MDNPYGISSTLIDDYQSVVWTGRQNASKPLAVLMLILACFLGSCTTLKPIDVDAVTLHDKIRSGQAIKVGDTIRAITFAGTAHLLVITAINDRVITGHPPGAARDVADTELLIDDIVLIEVSRLSSDNPRRFATGTAIGAGIGVVAGLLIFVILSP